MNATLDQQIWAAAAEADDAVQVHAMVASAFGTAVDEHVWARAFVSAMAGPAPYTIRIPARMLEAGRRRQEDARLEFDQMLLDYIGARRRGVPLETVDLRHTARPERRLARAKARELRRSIGRGGRR